MTGLKLKWKTLRPSGALLTNWTGTQAVLKKTANTKMVTVAKKLKKRKSTETE
jgi:hypothetical protein